VGFQPDTNQRIQEGVQRYESQMEDLERAARHVKHGDGSRASRRWLWIALAVVAALVVMFVIYQVGVPTTTPLPVQPGQ